MKKLYTLLAFTVMASISNAQMTFGPKIGGNLSKFHWSEGVNNDSDPNYEYDLGWQIGGVIDYKLGEKLSVRPGILLNKLSAKYKAEDVETTYSSTYIQLPIDLVLSLPLSSYHLKLSVGPYFQRGISGKVKRESGNTSDEREILFEKIPDNYDPSDNDIYANPWDIGVNFGIGYQIEYFLITFQYGLGLSNTAYKYKNEPANYDRKDEEKKRWSNFTLSLAYLFHPEN